MEFFDKELTCRECSKPFLFTAGEQEFYKQKGLLNEPGRCPDCRIKRRLQASAGAATAEPAAPQPVEQPMVVSTSIVKEVTIINCAECGKETTVPFRPRLARPVYCSTCFNKQRAAAALAVVSTGTPEDQDS